MYETRTRYFDESKMSCKILERQEYSENKRYGNLWSFDDKSLQRSQFQLCLILRIRLPQAKGLLISE